MHVEKQTAFCVLNIKKSLKWKLSFVIHKENYKKECIRKSTAVGIVDVKVKVKVFFKILYLQLQVPLPVLVDLQVLGLLLVPLVRRGLAVQQDRAVLRLPGHQGVHLLAII